MATEEETKQRAEQAKKELQARLEQEAALSKLQVERLKNLKDLAEIAKDVYRTRQLEDALTTQELEAAKKVLELKEFELGINEEQLKVAQKHVELTKIEQQVGLDKAKTSQDSVEIQKTLTAEQLEAWITAKQALNTAKENLKTKQDLAITEREIYEQKKKQKDLEQEIDQTAGAAFKSSLQRFFGISDSWRQTSLMANLLTSDGDKLKATFARLGKQSKVLLSGTNLLGLGISTVTSETLELAKATDQALSSFMKATGAGREYNEIITDVQVTSRHAGLDVSEIAQSTQALYESMASFTGFADAAAESLIQYTAAQSELGIDAHTTAKSLNFLVQTGLATTADEAINTHQQMTALAKQMGVSTKTAAADFQNLSGTLIAHGDKMMDVFSDLMETSKRTGVEMSRLMDVAKKFDTFEGAADSVGKLNALLGGNYLNSVTMVGATEEERLNHLAEMIDLSGTHLDSMGRYQRIAMAQAMGFKDVGEMMMVLKERTGQLSMAEQEELETKEQMMERAAAAQNVMERLTMVFQSFAVAIGPIVTGLKIFMGWIVKLADGTNGWYIPTMIALISLYKVLTLWTSLSGHAMAYTGKKALLLAAAVTLIAGAITARRSPPLYLLLPIVAAGIWAMGIAADMNEKALLSLGAAVAMAGLGVSAMFYSMAQLAESMAFINTTEQMIAFTAGIVGLVAALYIFTISIGALAAATTPVLPLILGLGAGFLLFGGAVALAGFGLKMAGEGMALMFANITLETAAAVHLLGSGFAALAVGVGALAASLALVKTDDLKAIADISTSLGTLDGIKVEGATSNLHKFVTETIELAENKEAVSVVNKLVGAASAYNVITAAAPAAAAAAAGTAIAAASPAAAAPTGGSPRVDKVEVVVQLDKDRLGRTMAEWNEKAGGFRGTTAFSGV